MHLTYAVMRGRAEAACRRALDALVRRSDELEYAIEYFDHNGPPLCQRRVTA